MAAPRIADVFVPGGTPTFTYNPREGSQLEESVQDYLDEGQKLLSVTGPTKIGKTVLIRSVLQDRNVVHIAGGSVASTVDLWMRICDDLNIYTGFGYEQQHGTTELGANTGEASIVGFAKISGQRSESETGSTTHKFSATRSPDILAREALLAGHHVLVIDDFHYIDRDVQKALIRQLKEPIFSGLRVIAITVPHRAFDAARVEADMTMRVEQISLNPWSHEDLRDIARRGFAALGLTDPGEMYAQLLAEESVGSPYLMQEFCLQLCKDNHIKHAQNNAPQLQPPVGWAEFFERRARNSSKHVFDRLARGPVQRTRRKERVLRNGIITDIYGLILVAIGHVAGSSSVTYEQIRSAVSRLADGPPPRKSEITRALECLSNIAREASDDGLGDSVVEYDKEMSTLYIADPFFSFFLKWGAEPHLRIKSTEGVIRLGSGNASVSHFSYGPTRHLQEINIETSVEKLISRIIASSETDEQRP